MNEFIYTRLSQSNMAKEAFAKESSDKIIQLSEEIVSTFTQGGKVLIFGNGGSAADAQHMAAEFVNRFLLNRRPLPAIALTTDTSVLTSIGNDFSYEMIFTKQIQALGKPEDLALGITTSATSQCGAGPCRSKKNRPDNRGPDRRHNYPERRSPSPL